MSYNKSLERSHITWATEVSRSQNAKSVARINRKEKNVLVNKVSGSKGSPSAPHHLHRARPLTAVFDDRSDPGLNGDGMGWSVPASIGGRRGFDGKPTPLATGASG